MYVFVLLYSFPLLAKFDNTVKRTMINAWMMSIRHLPFSILMLVVAIGLPILSLYFAALFFFLPGVIGYINAHFFARIFEKYIPDEEEEEFHMNFGDEEMKEDK